MCVHVSYSIHTYISQHIYIYIYKLYMYKCIYYFYRIDQYNRKLRDVAFNKVIHYNNGMFKIICPSTNKTIYSINYVVTRSTLAIAWQDLVEFNTHVRQIILYY